MAALARGHALVAGANVPAVTATGLDDAIAWVALDCDAVADFETTSEYVEHGGVKPKLVQGAALTKQLMETLARCHRVTDPQTGGPVCLGGLSAGNILYGPDGNSGWSASAPARCPMPAWPPRWRPAWRRRRAPTAMR